MKFYYEAVDGYNEVIEWDEQDALKNLEGYEFGPYSAVSYDGVSKLHPDDQETEKWWSTRWYLYYCD